MHSPLLRALAVFWGAALLAIGAGAVTLQILGPPDADAPAPASQAEAARQEPITPAPVAAPPAVIRPAGSPVPPPDPALLMPAPSYPGASLPRIAADGRASFRVYAAGYDPSDTRPRIAVLLSGVGMSEQESEEAIRTLPAAVSLAFSPYALHLDRQVGAARARGHELLLSVPMEPQNYPINDAGSYALLARATPEANAARLEWVLSRFAGYVGATGALGRLRGERFSVSDQMPALLKELGGRGLLYVDPRLDAPPSGGGRRGIDLVLDEPPVRIEIESRLARLEQRARDRGTALGLAGGTAPVVVERLAAWSASLSQRGFALVPVSALVEGKP